MSMSSSSAPEAPLLQLHQAVKHYGRRRVLSIEHLALHRGERLLVLGANGSGKSTLLRVMAGVASLSAGRLERSAHYESLRVCLLPQAGGLLGDLTLADNLRQWALLTGAAPLPDLARQWYLREFDLLPYLDTRCRDLSGGFQRLAALACALSTRPQGLFADEPLSGIDAGHAKVTTDRLGDERLGLQFLVVTGHDPNLLPSASRTLRLMDGQPTEAAT
jgi:ABC-type multidrug transport system ATPase subunit